MRPLPHRVALAAALVALMLAGCAPPVRKLAPAPAGGRADLFVALERLAVDEAVLRAEAGFDTQPTGSDIEGTRAHMLEKVLETDKFPFALIRVSGAGTGQGEVTLSVAITLHGITRTLQAPARIDAD